MKGFLTQKVLEILGDATVYAGDFFLAFLRAGYGASRSGIEYELYKIQRDRTRTRAAIEQERAIKRRYYNLLAYLKEDGLIVEKVKGGRKFFARTLRGRHKLNTLQEREQKTLPPPIYQAEGQDKYVIITFDVPERERRKRDWLRSVLRNLGLKKVQKSVWLGKIKIPKNLIEDIGHMRMAEYVEIFEISKTGSLRHLI